MKKIIKNKGFTIVELIVVMAIIAILILIAVPTFTKYIDNANKTARMGTADTIYKSAMAAVVEDYASPTHTPVTAGSPISTTTAGSLGKSIVDGVDGTVTITVYGYNGTTAPTRKATDATTWEVYIPSTTATGAGVADATKNIFVIDPVANVYENGDIKATTAAKEEEKEDEPLSTLPE